jgi:hypothetical protein
MPFVKHYQYLQPPKSRFLALHKNPKNTKIQSGYKKPRTDKLSIAILLLQQLSATIKTIKPFPEHTQLVHYVYQTKTLALNTIDAIITSLQSSIL